MSKLYVKLFLSTCILLFIFQISNVKAQCNINSCSDAPILAADNPVFDVETGGILINNIMFGSFGCSEVTFKSGASVYIYQLLPNGDRISSCTVTNSPPNNFIVNVPIQFGQVSVCDMPAFNFGTIPASKENGFDACDGAVYEIEIVMYVTELPFDEQLTVYDQLPTSQYIVRNLGTVAVNFTNEFPTNADPLTTASIKKYPTGETGSVQLTCGETLQLEVEALSRLSNCSELSDITTGVPSELSNEFYYSIDGAEPIILQDASTGAFGGQLTGLKSGSNYCYAGLLGIRDIEFNELNNIVEGSNVIFTVTTTDFFTEKTVQDQITIIYSGEGCATVQPTDGCTDATACNYNASATVDDGSCTNVVCNSDACAGDTEIIDPNDPCNCILDQLQVLGCTNSTANNYNPSVNCDDGSCDFSCLDPGTCDDGDCTNGFEIWDGNTCTCINTGTQIGCTDINACNYDPDAICDDGSCTSVDCASECGGTATAGTTCDDGDASTINDVYDVDCNCIGNQVSGCTDSTACNYNTDATVDDGSCWFETYFFNCNCTEPCSAGSSQDDECNCIKDCPPALSAGISTELSVCENDVPFNLLEALDGTPDPNGQWYFENQFIPFDDAIFTPGQSEDGVYLYEHWQGDECNFSQATVTINTNLIFETYDNISLCDGDSYTLPNGDVVNEGGSYQSILKTIEDCDSIINTMLIVRPLDCEGVCDGDAVAGAACVDGNGNSGTYEGDCSCVVIYLPGCADPDACNYDPNVTVDDGPCTYPESEVVDCNGNCIVEIDCNGDCGGSTVVGATCDDGNPNTTNDAYNADCNCVGMIVQPQCNSEAGLLTINDVGNFGEGNYVCFGSEIQIEANDFLLNTGQSQYYIFHTDNINANGSFPVESIIQYGNILTNNLGQLAIYATAVAAVDDGTGQPNFNDACTVYSNTLIINLLNEITFEVNESCDPVTSLYSFTFLINGGLPESLNEKNYTVTGDYFNGYVEAGKLITVGPISRYGMYDLIVSDENGCSVVFSNDYDCGNLPITLISFSGEVQAAGDSIKWITASEINNDYYTLQHSIDGENFVTIAQIPGAGTSSDVNRYEYFNSIVVEGYNYYKLLQTDFDNITTEEGIIELNRIVQSIENGEAVNNLLNVYPLPAEEILYIDVENNQSNQLSIYNATGQKIDEWNYNFHSSNKLVTIDIKKLSSGLYVINIVDDGKVKATKFVKQ